MTLRRAEVNEGGACLPWAGKKRRVVSGRSHPLVVGNLKMRSLTLRSSKEKLCLRRCRTSESIKWHWKWSHGRRLCCSEKLLRGRFYLNVERWNQCSKVSSGWNRAKKDDKLSAQLDEHSPASRLVVSEERSKIKLRAVMVNGLLFHMTQPTSRSIMKAIACSKPTISEH